MKAHSTELKLSAVAQAVTCGTDVAQAQAQPSFSYCHSNTANSYGSNSGAETARYLVDGNFSTGMSTNSESAFIDFTLSSEYVGKTLTKFAYWFTINSTAWNQLGQKIKTFGLYYHDGTAFVFYKTLTSVVSTIGSTVEEWDIDMPCPTGRVRVTIGKNWQWGDLVIDRYRRGTEIAFGCWT